MTCPTAVAAVQSSEVVEPDASHLVIDVRLVMPFPALVEGAPPAEQILTELRDALEEDGIGAFLDLAYETNSPVHEEIHDLQLFDAEARS